MNLLLYLPLEDSDFLISNINVIDNEGTVGNKLKDSDPFLSKDGSRAAAILNQLTITTENLQFELELKEKYLQSKNIYSFYMNFDYKPTPPFGLVCYEDDALFELTWNKKSPEFKNLLNSKAYIWRMHDDQISRTDLEPSMFEISGYESNSLCQDLKNQLFHRKLVFLNKGENVRLTTVVKVGSSIKIIYDDIA